MFLFDTDHLGILQQQTQPYADCILRRMSEYDVSDFYVSVVSFQEQMLGWNAYLSRARTEEAVVRAYRMLRGVLTDFSAFQVLDFDHDSAALFSEMRTLKVRIGTMDLRIGATAITRAMVVLTRNTKDFAQIPGIQLADWTLP